MHLHKWKYYIEEIFYADGSRGSENYRICSVCGRAEKGDWYNDWSSCKEPRTNDWKLKELMALKEGKHE